MEGKSKKWRHGRFYLPPTAPAMPVYDTANVCKSNPRAFKLISPVQTLKDSKEFVGIIHIKAYAVIADEYDGLRSPGPARSQFRFPPAHAAG